MCCICSQSFFFITKKFNSFQYRSSVLVWDIWDCLPLARSDNLRCKRLPMCQNVSLEKNLRSGWLGLRAHSLEVLMAFGNSHPAGQNQFRPVPSVPAPVSLCTQPPQGELLFCILLQSNGVVLYYPLSRVACNIPWSYMTHGLTKSGLVFKNK